MSVSHLSWLGRVAWLIPWLWWSANGQLAITEAMSSASTNNALGVTQGPDFWELTNFGSERIDLTGYRWNDNEGGLAGADASPFVGLVIEPGEVIVFVQNNVPGVDTAEAFRAWWGLPPDQKVVFYTGNGLSSNGDSVILWGPNAAGDDDVVDRVDFGPANPGYSFTYSPVDGTFGVVSEIGVGGAQQAVLSTDVGSPGQHAGPVTLRITLPPTNMVAVAGLPASMAVQAVGLPRPRYQWRRDGVPLPGATRSILAWEAVQPGDAGTYSVEIRNGLQTLVSSDATLQVVQTMLPPSFTTVPSDVEAYPGQSVVFVVGVQGQPPPVLQWFKDGMALAGETSAQLRLGPLRFEDGGSYTLRAQNLAGITNVEVRLAVTNRPRLLITEVHSTGSAEYQDWWELTNFDIRTVNLRGYRFDDDSRSLAAAYVIAHDLVIEPGESIVFVESTAARPMTPERFRSWWGPARIAESVKIVVYQGAGLGLSSSGDAVYLWNAAATEDADFVCGVTFGTASANPRRTFVYDFDRPEPQAPYAALLVRMATNGVHGAFAAVNGDVGSPGRVTEVPSMAIAVETADVVLTWPAVVGQTYVLEQRTGLGPGAGGWAERTRLTAEGTQLRFVIPRSESQGYYRLGIPLPLPAP